MRTLAAIVLVLAFAPAAAAATSNPVVTNPLVTTIPAAVSKPHTSSSRAIAIFLGVPKVSSWLRHYPPKPSTDASLDNGQWTVQVFSGRAGEIATGLFGEAALDDQLVGAGMRVIGVLPGDMRGPARQLGRLLRVETEIGHRGHDLQIDLHLVVGAGSAEHGP